MRKLLLLSIFTLFCLSTNPAQETLEVTICRPFKRFGFGQKLWAQGIKTIALSICDFSDETTIAELKKKIILKAGISMKALNRSILMADLGGAEYENNKTCQDYNLRKKGHIILRLSVNNVVADFFGSVLSPKILGEFFFHKS